MAHGPAPIRAIAAIAATAALAGCGGGAHSAAPSTAQLAADLKGSPPPLARLHRQAGQLLGGGTAAMRARLRSLRGYPVVVTQWASWCGPCQAEFPYFQQLSATLGRRVAFIGNDANDPLGDARGWLRRFPVSFPSYRDPSGQVALRPEPVLRARHPGDLPLHTQWRAVLERRPLRERQGPAPADPGRPLVSEIFVHSLSGLRTIVAPGRGRRCHEGEGDPFAEGNEPKTPPELFAIRPPGERAGHSRGGGSRLPESLSRRREARCSVVARDASARVHGAPGERGARGHRELAESRRRARQTRRRGRARRRGRRERMRAHPEAAALHLFVNERAAAGAIPTHTHAQLLALDFVPALIARERERFGAYATRTLGQQLLDDLVSEEVRRARAASSPSTTTRCSWPPTPRRLPTS